MVKDGLATTNADLGTGNFDNLLGHPEWLARDGVRHQRGARHDQLRSCRAATRPNVDLGVAPFPGPGAGPIKGGVLVSGGALYMVNKSAPAKQAAAWQFLKFLDTPENMTTWAIGTGYIPILKASADELGDAGTTGRRTRPTRSRTTSCRTVRPTWRPSGSVIGNYTGVRDAVRDAENTMFLNGTDPKAALKDASTNSTAAIEDYNARLGG